MAASEGPLKGVKVLDLSRILAGPTCTQLLGDLGATVIKIENPATGGDDTRQWGPPYVKDAEGNASDLSAYFMSANRNKKSVALDISSPEGQAEIRRLASHADILIENFKPGGLAKFGLDYANLSAEFPGLVYCSISGYGQTGPNASKPGYDLMAQGYGGIMSLTGDPDGAPMKVGVGIADVMCGMYATVGILAALRHRDQTGEGQQIDLALVDTQVSWLINEGVNYLTSGNVPQRRGNGHPNIVPYDVYETADGHVILAVGNDSQFRKLCGFLDQPELAEDPRFATNPSRLEHRDALNAVLRPAVQSLTTQAVIAGLEAVKVPVGPVQTLDQVFSTDQVAARQMQIAMQAQPGTVDLIGNPLKLSRTPVTYRSAPPVCGADTSSVLNAENPFED
ncbi:MULTISPECIES: CaiB/BaiF CoA-transferase family protein [unclassified Ruegeria]|uniref:CaiB/BaiF CoA transferase family protein n=1 Tax=unclassified Ruegeria TaxID=2625375 RepID=UPI001487BC95|nr:MULTISPECIES: CaiB/BaiF CoA-transferase family protein [unclassified Ruegeria]